MKKYTLFIVAILLFAFQYSYAQSITKIRGKNFQVDTLFHAKVGPGTTQTSVKLTGLENNDKYRLFFLTVDRSASNISFAAVAGTEKVAGYETPSSMAKRKSTNNKHYFAGVNGGFYRAGTAANGTPTGGTPTSTLVVDGEVYTGYSHVEYQFAFDRKFEPFLQNMRFNKSTVSCNGKTAYFKAVNTNVPNHGTPDIGGVTLFTPKYYGCTDQASQKGLGYQVLAQLVEGDKYSIYAPYRMKIISEPADMGNVNMPAGCYVLHGHGGNVENGTNISGIDFVKNLKTGDIVTFNHVITMKDTPIVPSHVVSGHPWVVYCGKTWENCINEGGYGNERHPRTCLGYTKGKEKVIMMVVDGRSSLSVGANGPELGDIMVYAGAEEAVNIDGGGSACLYTEALGIRNRPSDGKERAVSHGLFVVSESPQDNEIASIEFREWSVKTPQYGEYSPVIYGYNKYGMLVNDNVQDYTLEADPELGYIVNGKMLVASGTGLHALKAVYNGATATVPVQILNSATDMAPRYEEIVYDGIRDYAVEVKADVNGIAMNLSPQAFVWRSANEEILKIGKNDGKLEAVADGETYVEGTLGDRVMVIRVKVQKPKAATMAVDRNFDPASWKVAPSGVNINSFVPFHNGMKIDYAGASGRARKISLSKENLLLWSLPDAVKMTINPGDAAISSIIISFVSGQGETNHITVRPELKANENNVLMFDLKNVFDTSDIGTYPVKLGYISLNFGKVEIGKKYSIQIPELLSVYNNISSVESIGAVNGDGAKLCQNPVNRGDNIVMTGIPNGLTKMSVITMDGVVVETYKIDVESNVCSISSGNLAPGMYIVKVEYSEGTDSFVVIIR